MIIPIAKQQIRDGGRVTGAELETMESCDSVAGTGLSGTAAVVFAPISGGWRIDFRSAHRLFWLKVAELVLVLLGVWTIHIGNLPLMFLILLLLGTQCALLSTAKIGLIPELVPRQLLSAANGVAGLAILVAVIVGTIAAMNWVLQRCLIPVADCGERAQRW